MNFPEHHLPETQNPALAIKKLKATNAALLAKLETIQSEVDDECLDRIQELAEENKRLRRMLEQPLAVMDGALALKAEAQAMIRNARLPEPLPEFTDVNDTSIVEPCFVSKLMTQVNAPDNTRRELIFRSRLDEVEDDWTPQDKSPKYLRGC